MKLQSRSEASTDTQSNSTAQPDLGGLNTPRQHRAKMTKTPSSSTPSAKSTSNSDVTINSTPLSFELTPLSCLIAQSFKDIETLRTAASKARVGHGKLRHSVAAGASDPSQMIDFEKVEANLKRFEELYRSVSFDIPPISCGSFYTRGLKRNMDY
jgi:hypothetical protein